MKELAKMYFKPILMITTLMLSSISYADLSISENLQQAIAKIERPANCEVSETISRNALPPTPNNMTLPEFGKGIIGWGSGPEGAVEKIQNLHLSDVQNYQKQGVTLAMLQEWQAFYENETQRNSCNPTAPRRAQLMQKIIQHWS